MMTRLGATLFLLTGLTVTTASFADEPTDILFEAESMRVEPADSWQTQETVKAYNGHASGRMMLSGRGSEGVASHRLTIGRAGAYTLWVRYLDTKRNSAPFKVAVFQNGNPKADAVFHRQSLRAIPEGERRWGKAKYMYVWVWQPVPVMLDAGEAEIVLSKESDEGTYRSVDCFLLTDRVEYEPVIADFLKPLFVKIRMGADHPEPCFIHVSGKRPFHPYSVPHQNITQKGGFLGARGGMVREASSFLSAHEESPWWNMAPYLAATRRNRVEFTAVSDYGVLLREVDFTILVASGPSDEEVLKRFSVKGRGAGTLVTFDLEHGEIRSAEEWAQEAWQAADALPAVPGRRPVRFPILTTCMISPELFNEKLAKLEVDILSRLGMSGTGNRYEPLFMTNGFVHVRGKRSYMHLARQDHRGRCHVRSDWDEIRQRLALEADGLKERGLLDKLLAFILDDEPAAPTIDHVLICPDCRNAFHVYLQRKNVRLADIGAADWSAVRPTDDPEENPILYYYTHRFRSQVIADFFRFGREVLQSIEPDIRVTANFAPPLTHTGNLLGTHAIDWFLMQQEALNYGWSEDWLNQTATYQYSGYLAEFMRAACEPHGQDFALYNVWKTPGKWDTQAKTVTEIGHGAKAIFHYTYGPAYSRSSDARSTDYDRYSALKESNFAVGAVEAYLLPAHVVSSRVALHYSNAADIWTLKDNYSVFGRERMGLYLLLRHLGYPVDIVTDDDIREGRLRDYKVVFLLGSHVDGGIVDPLVAWTRQGGLAYLAPGTGAFDQYGRPLDLHERLGVSREPFSYTDIPSPELYHYPLLKALDTVDFGAAQLDAVCGLQKMPAGKESKILARFSDGTPAATLQPFGKGQVAVCGFFPGIGYVREARIAKARLSEALEQEGEPETYYGPYSYPEGCRRLLAAMMKEISYRPAVRTDHCLVEACHLDGAKGTVIPLINWSGRPVEDVRITIRPDKQRGNPFTVVNKIKSMSREGEEIVLTLDMGPVDFIVLPAE